MSSPISQDKAENQAQVILYHTPSPYSVHLILTPDTQVASLSLRVSCCKAGTGLPFTDEELRCRKVVKVTQTACDW